MVDKMILLHHNQWDLVSLPNWKPTVGCRWVYMVMFRLKARPVAKGI